MRKDVSSAIDIMCVVTFISERTKSGPKRRTAKMATGDFGGIGKILVNLGLFFRGRMSIENVRRDDIFRVRSTSGTSFVHAIINEIV
jgi:hypothetical protein